MFRASAILGATAIVLAGCASVEPAPCSSEWVEARLEAKLRPFAIKNARNIQQLRQAASYIDGQTVTGAMRIAQAVNTLQNMAEDFGDEVMPEFREVSRQCGGDREAVTVFTEFLRDEGVDREVLAWVDALADVFMDAN